MTDLGATAGVGQRIQSVRKQRGFRSAADLAASIPGNVITPATLQNIEAGRKVDITVSQIFNIAYALRVAPIYLLVDIRHPDSASDLPGLSDDLKKMSAAEFDAWVSGTLGGAFEWASADDQSERTQLLALRELELLVKERDRLDRLLELVPEISIAVSTEASHLEANRTSLRRDATEREIYRLTTFLASAGWEIRRWIVPRT